MERNNDDLRFENQTIIDVDLNGEMRKSFLDYSMSVITSRALPDVRDGLKPVHRRILYTMHENSLYPDKAYRKCADTSARRCVGLRRNGSSCSKILNQIYSC